MPRYTPDPNKVSIGFTVLPKGTHRLLVEEPKSFATFDKNDKNAKNVVKNFGVRANSKIIESDSNPALVGKNFPISLYMHTDGAEQYSKSVYAAILGIKNDEEWNASPYSQMDWSFNTDDQSVGEGWHELRGKVVDVDCGEPELDEKSGNMNTKVLRYRVAQ